jgi:hypothetical protein
MVESVPQIGMEASKGNDFFEGHRACTGVHACRELKRPRTPQLFRHPPRDPVGGHLRMERCRSIYFVDRLFFG